MSTEEFKGFVVNSKTLSFILSLAAVGALFWQITGYVLAREYRMDSLEGQIAAQERRFERQEALNEKIATQIEKLNENILRLTVVLEKNKEVKQ